MQIGLSLLLLVGAGLFVRTLQNLKSLNMGFTPDHLVTFGIDPTLGGYDPKEALVVQKQLLDALATQPGVKSVAGTDDPMLTGDNSSRNVSFASHANKRRRQSHGMVGGYAGLLLYHGDSAGWRAACFPTRIWRASRKWRSWTRALRASISANPRMQSAS